MGTAVLFFHDASGKVLAYPKSLSWKPGFSVDLWTWSFGMHRFLASGHGVLSGVLVLSQLGGASHHYTARWKHSRRSTHTFFSQAFLRAVSVDEVPQNTQHTQSHTTQSHRCQDPVVL